ncbi:MAG: energy-coupling factor transporter transmembrane protein EcfT [Thermoleophilia bacterium]|jgi:energy-coupling factor transport system permease protein
MQLTSLTIGQFYPGTSLLHRVDPRTKIISSFAFVIVLFLARGFVPLALLGAILLAGITFSGIPLIWLWRGLRPMLILLLITFFFQLLFVGGEEVAHLGPIVFYREGLERGAFLVIRLVLLVLSGSLLTFTTPPVLLTDAFGRLISPLEKIKIPSYELALMMTIALRFIPTLLMELDRIIKAQRARGAGIGTGGPIRRARAVMPVLIPLFVMSFRHADELALAMESRCYRGGRGRTMRRKLKYGWRDAAFMAVVAVVLFLSLLIGI